MADDEAAIVEAVNACRARYDYVFTTGGIGPTHDDITAACGRQGVRAALRAPSRGRAPAARLLSARAGQRGAHEDGRHAGRGGADRQSGERRARLPDRERLRAAGRAQDHAGDARRAAADAPGRGEGAVARDHRLRARGRRRECRARRPPGALPRGRDRQLPVLPAGGAGHHDRVPRHRPGRDRRGRRRAPRASPPGSARRPGRTSRPRRRAPASAPTAQPARPEPPSAGAQSTTCQRPSGWRQAVP